MTPDRHKARHLELHEALDELVADFLSQNPASRPSTTPLMDLMIWSANQLNEPTDPRGEGETAHVYTVCGHCGAALIEGVEEHTCT